MGGGAVELTTLLDSVGWEDIFFTKFLWKNYQPTEFTIPNCQKKQIEDFSVMLS